MATQPKATPATDEQMIRGLAQEWTRHAAARSVDNLVNMFVDDGMDMAPFRALAKGKAALRQALQDVFEQYDLRDLKAQTTYVQVSGDTAFSVGTFTANVKLPNGKRIDDQGKWVVTLRRVGATWKIVAHCWNTDLPISSFTNL